MFIFNDKEKVRGRRGRIETITHRDENGKEYFFYTDDYCMGVGIPEMKPWVSSSCNLPMTVKERPGLESEIINTLEEYEFIFCKDAHRIESAEEFLKIINS